MNAPIARSSEWKNYSHLFQRQEVPSKNTRMQPLFKQLNGVTLITTMNTPKLLYRLIFGNAIKKAMLRGTFWKIGYKNRKWISFNMVKMVSHEKRSKWLATLEKKIPSRVQY